jgi:hypothetical protein
MKFFIIFLLAACSLTDDRLSANVPNGLGEIAPGMTKWVFFEVSESQNKGELRCRDTFIKTYTKNHQGKWVVSAFLAESYFSDLSQVKCIWKVGKEEKMVREFKVVSYDFPQEKLKVDYRKVTLRAKDLKRVQKEQIQLNELYQQSNSEPYFTGPFLAPLNSYITSIYGTKRVYNNHHKGQHLGTDFRAAIGVPIPSSNRGKVMLAQDLFYTGFTVIVDHGLDIFTVYAHLSELSVKVGDIVEPGHIIGKSGNTGRTSGPHLHWGVKIHGNWIDGFSLMRESEAYSKFFAPHEKN